VLSGILVLSQKGSDALKHPPADLTLLCRNILVQVDGKRSVDDLRALLRGLKGLDESLERLVSTGFVNVTRSCRSLVIALAEHRLGPKASTLVKKIDELHGKYGESCWAHLDELYKTARLFYGGEEADYLKREITRILQETHPL
jgi:hypothetical protein